MAKKKTKTKTKVKTDDGNEAGILRVLSARIAMSTLENSLPLALGVTVSKRISQAKATTASKLLLKTVEAAIDDDTEAIEGLTSKLHKLIESKPPKKR